MKLSDFDFTLPEERIATAPASPRDASRLLHITPSRTPAFHDKLFLDLPHLLKADDILVFNNTKVIPARLFGTRGTARIEATLHQLIHQPEPSHTHWWVFIKGARKVSVGDVIQFGEALTSTVIHKHENGQVHLAFPYPIDAFYTRLHQVGEMPLPPYITSKRNVTTHDADTYQTMFASQEGAVAAPTAGLHFTPRVLAALHANNIATAEVTLHVGGGTFLPVKTENIAEHTMHSEWYQLSEENAARINAAKARGANIIAVGTTALRTLESIADENGNVPATSGDTSIFITPGYRFRCVDKLLTNFHLPKSTLFMLVCAFSGMETMRAAYAHAIEQHYRFFSYGDACLLEKS